MSRLLYVCRNAPLTLCLHFHSMSECSAAIKRVHENDVRYRFVLDMAGMDDAV